MAPKADAPETDEQRKAREAKEEMERRLGREPSGDKPEFPLWKRITDQFTDMTTRKPDWAKIGLAGLGAIMGGVLASGTGIVGMALAATAGTALLGTAGVFLLDWIRKDKDAEKKAVPPPLRRPDAPEADTRVIAKSQILMPGVKTMKLDEALVDIPTYDVTYNPAAEATRAEIEKWSKIVAQGNPDSRATRDSTNFLSRAMLEQLEASANSNEINLRYLRDTLPDKLKAPGAAAQDYLKKLGPEAEAALSVRLDPMLKKYAIELANVPGQYGDMGEELETYGKEIKAKLIKELAEIRGVAPGSLDLESKKTIDTAWDKLNVIAKRNLIRNFAAQAIYETLTNPTDLRHFFPENEVSMDRLLKSDGVKERLDGLLGKGRKETGIFFNPGVLNPLNLFRGDTEQDKFVNAYVNNNLGGMADILEARLKKDDAEKDNAAIPASSKLTDDARKKMRTFILGFRAYDKNLALDKYVDEVVAKKEIPALHKFEDALLDHSWHVARVKKRMEAYKQGGSQFLVLEESKVEGNAQTFNILDTRTDKPQAVKVEVAYDAVEEGKPRTIRSFKVDGVDKTAEMKGKLVPAGDIDRFAKLQLFLEMPGMLAAAPAPKADMEMPRVDLSALVEGERGKTGVTYTPGAATDPAAPLWKMPVAAELPGSDKERKI